MILKAVEISISPGSKAVEISINPGRKAVEISTSPDPRISTSSKLLS